MGEFDGGWVGLWMAFDGWVGNGGWVGGGNSGWVCRMRLLGLCFCFVFCFFFFLNKRQAMDFVLVVVF